MKGKEKKRIAFLSPEGTFSDEAAFLRGGETAERIPVSSFGELIEAVKKRRVNEATIPSENLIISGIGKNLDLIIDANGHIKITGEIVLPIHQNLIADKKITLDRIKKVVSIMEATSQCDVWLKKFLPGVKKEYVGSTAEAIRDINKYGEGAVAIGSVFGAKIYGKKVLRRCIQDSKNNETHFYVISRSDEKKVTGKDKTSLIFTVDNHSGQLVKILNIFDVMNINLTRLESRSTKMTLGEYIFWVDIDGHRKEPKIKEALKLVAEKARFSKILGSYPKHNY